MKNRELRRRALAAMFALTASVGASGMASAADDPLAFTQAISGRAYADTEYVNAGILPKDDGVYTFDKDSTITTKGSGIDLQKAISIHSTGTVSINSTAETAGAAVSLIRYDTNTFSADVKKLDISVDGSNSKQGKIWGIHIANYDEEHPDSVFDSTIKGDVNIAVKGTSNVVGIEFGGRSNLTIDGNLSMWDHGDPAVQSATKVAQGIVNNGTNTAKQPQTLLVTGDAELTVDGTVISVGQGGIVDIKGGGSLKTKESSDKQQLAVYASGGTLSLNEAGKTLSINGNIETVKDTVQQQENKIDLRLVNELSLWNGVAKHTNGALNLTLTNGAQWNNKSFGTVMDGFEGSHITTLNGGATEDQGGLINQQDSHTLTIDQYKGYGNILYRHNGDGTKAEDYSTLGDTVIKNAAKGANITLITQVWGIKDPTDKSVTDKVLSALAQKLVYSANDGNLAGTVKIVDGLTASDKTKAFGEITFGADGRGSVAAEPVTPEGQTKTAFTTTLTGDETKDTEYINGGVRQSDGSYKFTEDSSITIDNTSPSEADDGGNQAIVIGKLDKELTIDAEGKTLTLNSSGDGHVHALQLNSLNGVTINAENLIINSSANSRSEGIRVGGQSDLNEDNPFKLTINSNVDISSQSTGDYVLGIYLVGNSEVDINGKVTMKGHDGQNWGVDNGSKGFSYYGASAIYTGTNYRIQKGPKVNVNGEVDLKVNGNGAFANGGGTVVSLKGGNIEVNKDNTAGYYGLIAESATLNMNVLKDAKGNVTKADSNAITLKGNIAVSTGATNVSEPQKHTELNLGLTTQNSTWTGVAYNAFKPAAEMPSKTETGAINLWLQNGATWTNEQWGKLVTSFNGKKFDGSHIANFTGGATENTAGRIFQNDSKTLTFDNYSGYTNVYYAHTGEGTATDDYKAKGDTIITNAVKGDNGITLITDNSRNVDLDKDTDKANAILNALAGKLTYSAYATGERNLTGTVKIAEGLTASSAEKFLKDGAITFDDKTGKGSYVAPPAPSAPTEFTDTLTGNETKDTEYVEAGIRQEDGTYKFTKESSINLAGGQGDSWSPIAGIATDQKTTVDASNQVLNLNVTGVENGAGIDQKYSEKDLSIQAKDLNIKVRGSQSASGIQLRSDAVATITGNVSVDVDYSDQEKAPLLTYGTLGISVYDSNLSIKGNTKISNARAGLYVAGDSSLELDGNYQQDVVYHGLLVDGNNTRSPFINIDGDVQMKKLDETKEGYLMEARRRGQIAINTSSDVSHIVNLTGNLYVDDYQDSQQRGSSIQLKMDNAASKFSGVAFNKGSFLLYLENGATWNNEQHGTLDSADLGAKASDFKGSHVSMLTGGESADKAGHIFQNDSKAITADYYSGYTDVYYAHTGDGSTTDKYEGGDTIISSAAEGSGISLITNNEGIDLADGNQVKAALNALAGKLYYKASAEGEKNLHGIAKIASGLTAADRVQKYGDVSYKEVTGQGEMTGEVQTVKPVAPDHQTTTAFTTTLTGNEENNFEYVEGGVLKDNTYTFTKDSSITNANAIVPERGIVVNASGHTLHLISDGADKEAYGINQAVGAGSFTGGAAGTDESKNSTIHAGLLKIDVTAQNGNSVTGIYTNSGKADKVSNLEITGNVEANVDSHVGGFGHALGISAVGNSNIVIHGDVTMKKDNGWGLDGHGGGFSYYGSSAIYANNNYGIQKGGHVTIDGNVDLKVNGNGLFSNGGGGDITVNGGAIEVNRDNTQGYYALIAESGSVNMNVAKDGDGKVVGAGSHKVTLNGNVAASTGATNPAEPAKHTEVNLGLATKDSSWTGVAYNAFKPAEDMPSKTETGAINLWLQNGAAWTNEQWGKMVVSYNGKEFDGSHIAKLTGGNTEAAAGWIFQNDSHAITVDNYSGYTNVYYAHTDDGTKAENYNGKGDTIITKAEKGSGISLITGNNGITLTDSDQVKKVLNALAGKLYYTASVTGEKNLTGTAKIIDGLTASSKVQKYGDISYKEGTGQGQMIGEVKPSDKPVDPDQPGGGDKPDNPNKPGDDSGKITEGDYETYVMKGIRSAATTNMHAWRDNVSDLYDASELADEDGIFAKVLGGKTSADTAGIHEDNTYWGGQVGYDRGVANGWHTGIAFDYRDGDSDYLLGGTGDDKLYSLGIYAKKAFDNGSHFKVAFKAGQVENKYTVYNEYQLTRLDGKYKASAVGLTAEYGKTFGGDNGYITPKVQLSWSRVGSDDYTAHTRSDSMDVHQDAYTSLVGRLGFEAGRRNARGGFYAGLNLAHEFDGDINSSYFAKDGGEKSTSYEGKDTWVELVLGGRYNLSDRTQFYADFAKDFGGDFEHKWKLNAGLKFAF